jgi:hypothetical protein
VIAAGRASEIVGFGGRVFTRFFLRHVDRFAARRALPEAAAYRLADANVTDDERARVLRLKEREAPRGGGASLGGGRGEGPSSR